MGCDGVSDLLFVRYIKIYKKKMKKKTYGKYIHAMAVEKHIILLFFFCLGVAHFISMWLIVAMVMNNDERTGDMPLVTPCDLYRKS